MPPPTRPRKAPKETVTYPASKRKAPPFKPQRPSQVPRVASTTESQSSGRTGNRTGISGNTRVEGTGKGRDEDEEEEGEGEGEGEGEAVAARKSTAVPQTLNLSNEEDSEDDVLADPLTAKPRPTPRPPPTAPGAARRQLAPRRQRSGTPLSSAQRSSSSVEAISASHDAIPSVPRPLLLRLLHEHFASPATKIDKQAVGVLEKYVELFVRESVARAGVVKARLVEEGRASQSDEGWLEKGDLEKVVAGVVLDF